MEILVIFFSYLLGSISFGYFVTRLWAGKDIRLCGSGSTGARNVGRVVGRRGFVVVVCGDFAKGMAALILARVLGVDSWVVAFSLVGVAVGHIYPLWLGFKGGKGVVVTLGGLFIFDWRLLLGVGVVFLLCYLISRKYMLSGIVSILVLPVMAFLMGFLVVEVGAIVVLVALVLLAHRRNIFELAGDFRGNA